MATASRVVTAISARHAKVLKAKSLATVAHDVLHSLPHQNYRSVQLQND
jgi:hypothetical protein